MHLLIPGQLSFIHSLVAAAATGYLSDVDYGCEPGVLPWYSFASTATAAAAACGCIIAKSEIDRDAFHSDC